MTKKKSMELTAITQYSIKALQGEVVGFFGSDAFKQKMQNLSFEKQCDIYLKLLPYCLPRLQATPPNNDNPQAPQLEQYKLRILELATTLSKPKQYPPPPPTYTQKMQQ